MTDIAKTTRPHLRTREAAAARIEALEAALREIADEQKIYKGHGDYDIEPALTANEAMMLARAALAEEQDA